MVFPQLRAGMLTGTVALLPLCLAEQSQPSPGSSASAAIEWSVDRPLAWDDFHGVPDASSKGAALTAYVIQARTSCAVDGPSFHVLVRFLPSQSWIKPRQRTDRILSHEQGHLDLAEVTARRLRARLASLDVTCADGQGAFTSLVADFNSRDADLQRSYDRQTTYGTDAPAQRRWESQIKSWLRSASARVPAPDALPQTRTR